MGREEKTILTNMCMVYDDCGNVLVEDRRNPEWPGITFPGGHVEHGESFVGSVIREVKEETGLDIAHPILCGIKQWYAEEDVRYVVLFFKTSHFSGTIQSSGEGEVCWLPRAKLEHCRLAEGMNEMLEIFEFDELTEFYFYTNEDGTWARCKKRLKKERDLEAQGVSKSRLLLYSAVVQKTAKKQDQFSVFERGGQSVPPSGRRCPEAYRRSELSD